MGYMPLPRGGIEPRAVPLPRSCWWRLRAHLWGEPEIRDLVNLRFMLSTFPSNAFPRRLTWRCKRCHAEKMRTVPMIIPGDEP